MNYYNEIDPYCCRWLANLMADGLIPAGRIDNRSIKDVRPSDLDGFTKCHFFAGIAGWSLALQLAGWPASEPVWTGSCPCQPFSQAGKRNGVKDDRHLWPEFFRLIKKCKPAIVMGEQVASTDGLAWLDGVYDDCESEGYAIWACDTCAACVGAPHIRQRLYWVADAGPSPSRVNAARKCVTESVGETAELEGIAGKPRRCCDVSGLGKSDGAGSFAGRASASIDGHRNSVITAGGDDAWSQFITIPCRDGKHRRISSQSGDEPLAYGLPRSVGLRSTREQRMELMAAKANRVGRLRGYGNGIVPEVAAEFIVEFMGAIKCQH